MLPTIVKNFKISGEKRIKKSFEGNKKLNFIVTKVFFKAPKMTRTYKITCSKTCSELCFRFLKKYLHLRLIRFIIENLQFVDATSHFMYSYTYSYSIMNAFLFSTSTFPVLIIISSLFFNERTNFSKMKGNLERKQLPGRKIQDEGE